MPDLRPALKAASDEDLVAIFRAFGGAILAPSTLTLLQTSFPEGRERTRAVAYYGAAGVGASLGLRPSGYEGEKSPLLPTEWAAGVHARSPLNHASCQRSGFMT